MHESLKTSSEQVTPQSEASEANLFQISIGKFQILHNIPSHPRFSLALDRLPFIFTSQILTLRDVLSSCVP